MAETKKRKPKHLPKVVSPEDFNTLLSVLGGSVTQIKNRVMFEVMYKAGLRVQEVCDLTPADVDLSKGMIMVQDGKNSKDRRIPIGPELMASLSTWSEIRPESEWFFSTQQGGQLNKRQIRAALERVSKKSGVRVQVGHKKQYVWPHSLRHSCATNWLDSGLSIREVQDLLGHESLDTTMRYTHVSMKRLDAKIKALG